MTRLYGRAPRGERLVAKVRHGHWKTLTLVAALRADGVTAPYVIDGAMDGRAFLAYVEQVLVPTLKKRDIVFMDNVRTQGGPSPLRARVALYLATESTRTRRAFRRCVPPVSALQLHNLGSGQLFDADPGQRSLRNPHDIPSSDIRETVRR
jgi:hypothetical protein